MKVTFDGEAGSCERDGVHRGLGWLVKFYFFVWVGAPRVFALQKFIKLNDYPIWSFSICSSYIIKKNLNNKVYSFQVLKVHYQHSLRMPGWLSG